MSELFTMPNARFDAFKFERGLPFAVIVPGNVADPDESKIYVDGGSPVIR